MTTDPHIGPYVSIDIETTGLNPENCQVLEIGAVIDDGTTPIEDCPTFHCYVDHGLILGEPFAVSMHSTILRRIATREQGYTYLQPWEVATRSREFLKEHGLDPAALYWQPEIDGVELPDTKTCMQRAGIGGGVAHTAVEDARMVALLIRRAIDNRRPLVPSNTSLAG